MGMGRALASASTAAAVVFERADAALGEPISRLAFEGPEDELNRTEHAQPALLAASVAYLAAIRERWLADGLEPPAALFAAGHSMGQYSALVASGALELEDALRLVRDRGRFMQASGAGHEGRMAAIIGLDDAHVDELLAIGSRAGILTLANRNSPGQIVLSGERPAVEAACVAARELGAKRAIELPVSVAAHSPFMGDAAAAMRERLAAVDVRDPSPPLLANADARPIATAEQVRAELVGHLTTGVDWVAAVEAMVSAGVATFIEVGPGRVLTGLIKRIAPAVETFPTEDPAAPDRLAVPFAAAAPA